MVLGMTPPGCIWSTKTDKKGWVGGERHDYHGERCENAGACLRGCRPCKYNVRRGGCLEHRKAVVAEGGGPARAK